MGLAQLYTAFHQAMFRFIMHLIEREWIPDFIIRAGIRYLLSIRLQDTRLPQEAFQTRKMAFVDELRTLPIAIHTATANEQHYELPTEYFCRVLGKWRKYSSCLYKNDNDSLDEAEENMLALYCEKLKLRDGLDVLELGCGWGSFALYAAKAFPKAKFTSVSNSKTQKLYIDEKAASQGITNLTVITANMVDFQAPRQFDRVISIEMFEHMKNYQELLKRVSTWMKPEALFFCHVFCHKSMPYHFEDNGDDDWMARYFFTGGTMPSLDLFLYFQEHLTVREVSYVNGVNYSRCLEEWLRLQDAQKREIMPLFRDTYGVKQAEKWFMYWRLFYLACSELFKYNNGNEWGVAHYLFEKSGKSKV